MPSNRHKPEEIVTKLRQVVVLMTQGKSPADAIRAVGVTPVTYARWKQEYGGLKSDQIKRLKELEQENAHLRRANFRPARSVDRPSGILSERQIRALSRCAISMTHRERHIRFRFTIEPA